MLLRAIRGVASAFVVQVKMLPVIPFGAYLHFVRKGFRILLETGAFLHLMRAFFSNVVESGADMHHAAVFSSVPGESGAFLHYVPDLGA